MRAGEAVVDADREVDLRVDADLVAGVEHGAREIQPRSQVRMPLSDLGVVVTPAMVADGEDVDAIDVPALQSLLPMLLVPRRADPGDALRCVKVEMDLPIWNSHSAKTRDFAVGFKPVRAPYTRQTAE